MQLFTSKDLLQKISQTNRCIVKGKGEGQVLYGQLSYLPEHIFGIFYNIASIPDVFMKWD